MTMTLIDRLKALHARLLDARRQLADYLARAA